MSHGWQNKDTDGSTGGWGLLSLSFFLAFSLTTYYLPTYLSICLPLSTYLSIDPFIYPSIDLSIFLSAQRRAFSRHLIFQKSGEGRWCFVHFDLKMCFAARGRLFPHLIFQKLSEPPTFMCFAPQRRAMRASFWHRIFQKVSKSPNMVIFCTLTSKLTSKSASRHSGAQFVIVSFGRRFSEPIFRPSGLAKHWKNTVLCDFPNISHTLYFLFCDSFSLSLLLFSFSWLFPSLLLISAYCRKFDF